MAPKNLSPKKTQTLRALALSAGWCSIFGAITVKNWRNWKSWDFLVWGTYIGPLQTLFIIRTKFWYKKCDKLAKVPTGIKLGVFLGIWKISCTTSVLRFKKFSYMPVLMSQGGVFHMGVKPPNSEKVYSQCVVDLWLPHLKWIHFKLLFYRWPSTWNERIWISRHFGVVM